MNSTYKHCLSKAITSKMCGSKSLPLNVLKLSLSFKVVLSVSEGLGLGFFFFSPFSEVRKLMAVAYAHPSNLIPSTKQVMTLRQYCYRQVSHPWNGEDLTEDQIVFHFSHRDDRWSDDHYEREKREVDWNFHKDSFFCDVPSEWHHR